MSGFFALKRSVYESARDHLSPNGYKILLEILCHSPSAKVVEIPFVFQDRRQGHSKLTPRVMAQYLSMLIRLALASRSESSQ